jgi:hypothetical protein
VVAMRRPMCLPSLALTVLIVVSMFSGCLSSDDDETVQPGELVVDVEDVERGTADLVEVYLEQGTGTMELAGGASKLMEATFRYNIDRWEPEISYTQSGNAWNLSIVQPNTDLRVATGARNEWDIAFGESVPIDMVVNVGAGDADMTLGTLDLVDLDINMGAGDLELDISDYSGGNLSVAIHCGVGDADVRVPEGMGVGIIPVMSVGTVSATGFTMAGTEYHSSDYDPDQPHITIRAILGVGDLTVFEV